MTSRLDRLLLLLDTGSSSSVRQTAAKQLAQLAAKSVVALEQDTKPARRHVSLDDPASWSELMAVVARILPYLHSRSHDTRTAASFALSQIFTLVPLWEPLHAEAKVKMETDEALPIPEFPAFCVQDLVSGGKLLLASSGKEFAKPAAIFLNSAEVKKARKEAMKRLGLDFLDGVSGEDDMDIEKELLNDDDVEMDASVKESSESPVDGKPFKLEGGTDESRATTPATSAPSPSPSAVVSEDMSARQLNRLKRKRKSGHSAFVSAPPPPPAGSSSKFSAAPTGQAKARLLANDTASSSSSSSSRVEGDTTATNGKVIIDPSKGGAVSPKIAQQSKALQVPPGVWIWDGVAKVLEVDLFSESWEVRHGAAMALRELLRAQGKFGGMQDDLTLIENSLAHERWCNSLAAKFLCVFVLDRFVDFVSDQAVAPVRETVSQTMASLMLHMPKRSALHVHAILLEMISQQFVLPEFTSKMRPNVNAEPSHIWQIRHAGLLGIKYEVAVRSDLFDAKGEGEGQEGGDGDEGKTMLRGVVDAAVMGLGDGDDDVRAVAASCLLPITRHLVEQVPDCLERVLVVVSRCLSDMRDDLSSSVGFVMDLLGDLVKYDKVIDVLADKSIGLPLSTLAPVLYPFFRHTISNVRLAVVQTLASFMEIESLPKTWMDATFLRLIFQNLVLEERSDIRDSTLRAWRSALTTISAKDEWLEAIVSESLLRDWFTMMMTPLGVPLNTSLFFHPTFQSEDHVPRERHNVDLNMKRQDLAILSIDVVLKARIAASHALAFLFVCWPAQTMEAMFKPIFMGYVDSTSILQKLLASIISEEWAHEYDNLPPPSSGGTKPLLIEVSPMAKEISDMSLAWLQGNPLPAYHEMLINLHGILKECQALLQSFALDCRLPVSSIPFLGTEVDVTDTRQGCFTITQAKDAVGAKYDALKASLGRTKKKELAVIAEKRLAVVATIERYADLKAEHDNRVSAAVAAAFVALKSTPDKVSPVVKGVMNGIKNEENLDLQMRAAVAVAAFVSFCVDKNLGQPAEKIVKNLCTFLCQDSEQTPTFSYTRQLVDGILSFRDPHKPGSGANGKDGAKDKAAAAVDPNNKAHLPRRGASLAFRQLSVQFGPRLLVVIPKIWHSMAGGLISAFPSGKIDEETDNEIEKSYGQDIIDSLSVLEATVPTFDEHLWPKLIEIFPIILLALRSRFAIIRQAAAKCVSTICDVITVDAMHFVVDQVIPLLSDPLSLHNRQGATELIYHIVQKLDIKALPYVIFLVVPILGRMSDSDEAIRSTATNTFASLVKMVPLESGLPDPPGFSEELLKRREDERQFLFQLLDGSKVEQYEIPVTIKAELRKYQQDGVNWLAFLAKYQLHGILCDDMGLGKTLQSICILASKHYERKKRHEETKAPDSVHLPSLIVCPPTLTGHWYYEILKYADNLKPMLYTGNARDRTKRLSAIKGYDIVITSYDIVRNDVGHLEPINWLYCILDEGHVIKNARTKLTKAVKCMKSQHRLILSGTPIQNNVLELWSLFDFLMPGFLGTESSFSERFSKPILSNRDGKSKNGEAAALALEALHKQVLPFLLRRLKEDVLNDLPPKIIQDYYCELSDLQKVLYDDFSGSSARTTAEGAVQSLDLAEKGSEQTHVFQALQYLRKLCNHPALVLKNDKDAISSAMSKIGSKPDSLRDMQHAPKLQALKQLLTDCGIGLAAGANCDLSKTELLDTDSSSSVTQHRVLIFCQMKQMLDIIETDLFKPHMPSVTYMRLDGGTDASKRHAIVQTFNSDPSIDCLLLTTHVGGLGLTLTGADTVIFVEHDWNPMKDLQAMDRAHRIGQKKVVNVYRLISKGTLEEKIMGLQRFKLNIANSVVTQQNSGMASMDTDLVLDLFKRTGEEEDALVANKKKQKESSSSVSQKNVLTALQDLPAEDEYDALDLSSFMSSLGR